jgi:hypothetical protein
MNKDHLRLACLALAATFLILPASAAAQSKVDLRGKVVEMGTSRPLAGAEVVLPDLNRYALTNEAGDFVVAGIKPGRHRVEVMQLGYRKYEGDLAVSAEEGVRLELWPDPVVLEALTAQVDRLRSRRNAIAATVRVLDRSRLTDAIDVESALRSSGEVLVRCGTFSDMCIWRRGRAVQPIVYIDERPAFMGELSTYQPEDFQLIEVIGHTMIRAYTVSFMERLAMGKATLFPVLMLDRPMQTVRF